MISNPVAISTSYWDRSLKKTISQLLGEIAGCISRSRNVLDKLPHFFTPENKKLWRTLKSYPHQKQNKTKTKNSEVNLKSLSLAKVDIWNINTDLKKKLNGLNHIKHFKTNKLISIFPSSFPSTKSVVGVCCLTIHCFEN